MKKPVYSSHLALRFYLRDGWSLKELEKYIVSGSFIDTRDSHGDSDQSSYFTPSVGTVLDCRRLVEEISKLQRWYQGPPKESDLEYLESFNW